MVDSKWYWREVPFIPYKMVDKHDMLRFQGHVFIKSNILKRMKVKGTFKKEKSRKKRRDRRSSLVLSS